MVRITHRAPAGSAAKDAVSLPFESRRRSRLRATLVSGGEAALFLPRGSVLKDGDLLRADDGRVIQVLAAPERVSRACTGDALLLARAAYHLGNRHVALQVAAGCLCYLHDPVLDDMVRSLGLEVTTEEAPFEPEAGAYGGHGHSHDPRAVDAEGRNHGHAHPHVHDSSEPGHDH